MTNLAAGDTSVGSTPTAIVILGAGRYPATQESVAPRTVSRACGTARPPV